MLEQLYNQKIENIVASNQNNNVGQSYYIYTLYKMTIKGYESYEIIGQDIFV